jgi:predicted nucleic acid-binding Zn ribbon protein
MIDKNEKTCPYCGGHSPLGTPCSADCEEHHNKYQARAVWHKRFMLVTIAVCILWMLRGTIPMPVRAAIAIGWAVWLCIARIVLPYSYRVVGCEKKTERESRIIGIFALGVLGAVLLFIYTLDAKDVHGILSWIVGRIRK